MDFTRRISIRPSRIPGGFFGGRQVNLVVDLRIAIQGGPSMTPGKTIRLAFLLNLLILPALLFSTTHLVHSRGSIQAAPVQLSLPAVTAASGQVIMDLTINTVSATRGLQFGVAFDPAVLRCDGVTQGTFYSNWADSHSSTATVFPSPVCNNTTGRISDMGIILLGTEPGGPTGSGVVARLRFTVLSNSYSPVTLINVQVSDDGNPSQALPVTLTSGSVNLTATTSVTPTITRTPSITPTSTTGGAPASCSNADANQDGSINILDLTAIGSVMGQTGTPGWIPEDVNQDGIINILDLTAVSQCMGQTVSTFTPTFTVTRTSTGTTSTTPTLTPSPSLTGTPTFTPTRIATVTPSVTGGVSMMSINPLTRTIAPGENFTFTIDLRLQEPSRGAQAGLSFNPAVIQCTSVQEGDFYSAWAAANGAISQVFPSPVINNTLGTISSSSVILLGGTGGPSGYGSLFTVQCTGLAAGTSPLQLTGVQVSDANFASPAPIDVLVNNGSVTVAPVSGPSNTPTFTPTPSLTPSRTLTTTITVDSPTSTPTLSTQSRLSVSPPRQSVLIGQTVIIPIVIEVAASSPSKGAQVGIAYNPAVLSCTQLTEGSFYKDWALANGSTSQVFPSPVFNNTLGTMSTTSVILLGTTPGGPTGRGTLFEVRCTSLAAGVSPIHLTDGQVADDNTGSAGAGALTLELIDGEVTVANQTAPTVTSTPTRTAPPTATRTRTMTPTIGSGATATRTYTQGTPTVTSIGALRTGTAVVTIWPTIAANAHMNVNPSLKLVSAAGETFTLEITIDSDKPARSAGAGVKFDPAVMSCESVTEGGFFRDWATANGGSTVLFPQPVINNTTGIISDAVVFITEAIVGTQDAAGGPTQKGVFLTLNCTAKSVGVSTITLQNIELSNDDTNVPQKLAVRVGNGQVFVGVTPTPGGSTPTVSGGTAGSGTAPRTPTPGTGTPKPTVSGSVTAVPTAGIQADSNSKQVVAQVQTDASGKTSAVACFDDQIDSSGIVTEDIQVSSPDNLAAIRIAKGVQVLTADNYALKCIEFAMASPAPGVDADHFLLSVPYEIGPSGATFDPPATLLLAYDKGTLPENVNERRLVINWHNLEINSWEPLSSDADPDTGTVSAELSHLSVYAVLGQPASVNWLAILAGLGIAALLAVGAVLTWRHRNSSVTEPESPAPESPAPDGPPPERDGGETG
jgi:hypothetical protein